MHKKYKTRIGAAMEEFLDLQKERSFCAADACHYMEQREIAVNITTVYRHLEQLVKDGILVKFKTADSDNQRYRLAGDVSRCQRHLHLQCRRCGRIRRKNSEDERKNPKSCPALRWNASARRLRPHGGDSGSGSASGCMHDVSAVQLPSGDYRRSVRFCRADADYG